EAAIRAELQHGCLHAAVAQDVERLAFAAIDERRAAEHREPFRPLLALDHGWKIRLAVEAVRFAELPAELHEVRVLPHAGVADEQIGAPDGLAQFLIAFGIAREAALQNLHLRKARAQHRGDALI